MRDRRWTPVALGVAILLAGPQKGRPQHLVISTDVGGVELVTTRGGPRYDGPLFELQEDLVLGPEAGGPEWRRFGGPPEILVAPDGEMVLTDPDGGDVYILNRDGELVAQVGEPGRGSGAITEPGATLWTVPGESFVVLDFASGRGNRFSMTGESMGSGDLGALLERGVELVGSVGEDRFLIRTMAERTVRGIGEPVDQIIRYRFLGPGLEPMGDPIELVARSHFAITAGAFGQIPYTRDPELIPFPDGRLLLSDPEEGRLEILSSAGDPLLLIERDWDRPRLSEKERRDGRRPYAESGRSFLREVADRVPFPERHPAFSRAFPDDEGRIWVEYVHGPAPDRSSTGPYRYDVFGPHGVWLGIQDFDFRPLVIHGQHVYRRSRTGGEDPAIRRYILWPLVPIPASRELGEGVVYW